MDFENELLEKQILRSKSANSYIELLKRIERENKINFKYDFSLSNRIVPFSSKRNQEIVDCHDEIFQTDEYPKSKAYQLENRFKQLRISPNSSPREVVGAMLEILDKNDFELTYYHENMLMFIDNFNQN